ncbi:Uncharacterised protein [Streptococcus pneumoniae]|nr:Uncharacterised protein [Streptococcus pneumoniae]
MEQSGKGGDFLSVFLKKYYLFLVEILAPKEKRKKDQLKVGLFLNIKGAK